MRLLSISGFDMSDCVSGESITCLIRSGLFRIPSWTCCCISIKFALPIPVKRKRWMITFESLILGVRMKNLPKFWKDEISIFINQFHLPKLLMPGSPPRPPIPNGVDPVSGLWGAAGVEEEAELELPPTGPDLITKWTVIPSCEMTFPNSFRWNSVHSKFHRRFRKKQVVRNWKTPQNLEG